MTRTQTTRLSGFAFLIGGGLLAFLVLTVPAKMPSGEPNTAALILALFSIMLLVGGLAALLALSLHNRWPGLAGVSEPNTAPDPSVAIRQGVLLAIGAGLVVTLRYFRVLDAAYFIVIFLILLLFEAFMQRRA